MSERIVSERIERLRLEAEAAANQLRTDHTIESRRHLETVLKNLVDELDQIYPPPLPRKPPASAGGADRNQARKHQHG